LSRTIPLLLLGMLACTSPGTVGRQSSAAPTPRPAPCPPHGGHVDPTGAVTFDSTEVDTDAVALPLPEDYQLLPTQAAATVSFVIDSTGVADLRTLSIEPGADSALASAVVAFMPHARFQPAILGGCRVRVWARWPWEAMPVRQSPSRRLTR
jgi:hypothetical protein